ncbi:hypothetical protein [Micromonospora thermarum]|uniref:Uncharacterized protein n=1 Tax=Micromonospora thermarum TaxID=2720024 RepID=A0ABX0Z8A0_9ACTN|nr:hypothetical protein [Micromonospora thermarum]NJP33703.1 hypothetical protein [Micromonospora thermarum]
MTYHPHQLHAAAALASLRRAVSYLDVVRDALLITNPQPADAPARHRSAAALAAYDELLRAEKADRLVNQRAGIKPAGATPAPVNPALLDVEADLGPTVHHAVMLVASELRTHPLLCWSSLWVDIADSKWDGRCDYLAAALPAVSPALAREVHGDLDVLDRRLRGVVGLDADRWSLPGGPRCPACGQRRLQAQISSPYTAAWTVVCDNDACRCRGPLCACAMATRPIRVRHIWPADSPLVRVLLAGLHTAPSEQTAA